MGGSRSGCCTRKRYRKCLGWLRLLLRLMLPELLVLFSGPLQFLGEGEGLVRHRGIEKLRLGRGRKRGG